jgi:7-cyano-7-deazaguanine synthase in queuosine biosynthesis
MSCALAGRSMAEHLFLCGLNQVQRARYGPGRELHLHGPSANVRLNIEDLRRRHRETEPELLADLLEIAVYVFAADCALSRGGRALKDFARRWRRLFHLVIAVRQPGSWTEPHRLHCLRQALEFLTEDSWTFEFVELTDPPGIQAYLPFSHSDNGRSSAGTIVPFSGGLDSFAGAVAELSQDNQHVVLLSRRIGGITDRRQRELAGVLKERYPKRVTHVPVHAGLTVKASKQEHTQRSRSFLLMALATAAAYMEQSDRILFYEHGIMSINLPIATQVVGARASRSTHPRSLMLLQQVARSIQAGDVKIENPFIWKTKTEIVRELKDKHEGAFIARSLSCSRTREISYYKPHCGTCAQCLQRRLSTLGAGASDLDPAEAYAVDLLTGTRQPGEDRAMAVDMIRSALEFRGMTDEQFAIRFASEFALFTNSFPGQDPSEVARCAADIFRRHGEFVRSVFIQAASDHAADLIDHALPDSCLLRIAIRTPGMEFDDAPIDAVRHNDLLDECAGTVAIANDDRIRLAVDSHRKQIVIDGLGALTSPTEYRIVSVLVDLFREDIRAERAPENFRTLSAEKLAEEASSTGDQSGRKAVSRLRRKIAEEYRKLYGGPLERDAVIENVWGQGYRINPSVRIVSPSQLRPR